MVVDSIVMTTCISLFKTPFGLWLNAKIFHLHKHAFLQMLFMHIYMRQFHFKVIVVRVALSNKS
jgi:hypothetical protein